MSTKSSTGLSKKLGIKAGHRICLLYAPGESMEILSPTLPEGVKILTGTTEEKVDVILFWPQSGQALVKQFSTLQSKIVPEGAIWAMIPKKKFARKRGIDFSWEELQTAGLQTDLVDNKVASFSDEDYGTRFVIRKEFRDKYRK